MTYKPEELLHVNYLWKDKEADKLNPLEKLVYRSNKLGEDQRVTNTGGGNTSAKLMETDPLTGKQVEVLWVKGSGGDIRTAKQENFASLYTEKLNALDDTYKNLPETGYKSTGEDELVSMFKHCTKKSGGAIWPMFRGCAPAGKWQNYAPTFTKKTRILEAYC